MGKRKKKGRPSLLDLQRRSLRLQRQQQQDQQLHSQNTRNPNPDPNPNQSSNPYLRFPNATAPRRATRRNPDPSPPPLPEAEDGGGDDEDEDEEEGSGKRPREKKLKLVLRLPPGRSPNSSSPEPAKRRIHDRGGDKTRSPASKATGALQGEASDSGPTTPLPDKKLLVFILDRLQKKDTYGVFSEPVDLNELPDYLEVIDHPMDFATVGKKLSSSAYQNLEQFEKDVFLISSNAMTYNAPDTIYYRQARAIHELAKKSFENLRQESDDNEPEPKTVRRGRPPSKNTTKKTASKSSERAALDFSSEATLANARDNGHWSNLANDSSRKGFSLDKPGTAEVSTRPSYGLRIFETYSWTNEHKSNRNDEYTGSVLKGVQSKNGKKPTVIDENRRHTYRQPASTSLHELPILSTFDGERKHLVPVGLYMEHAYARSLARFAANLGTIGWEIAAQRIQRALPHGTKFGRGWVGDSEAPQESQPPLLSSSPSHPSSQPKLLPCSAISRHDKPPERQEPAYINPSVEEGSSSRSFPPATAMPSRTPDAVESADPSGGLLNEGRFSLPSGGSGMQTKIPFKPQQRPIVQPTMNGLNAHAFGIDPSGLAGKMVRPIRPQGSFSIEGPMTHSGVLDMVSRSNNSFMYPAPRSRFDVDRAKVVGNPGTITPSNPLPGTSHDSRGPWYGLSQNLKPVSAPPDLNVSFQSPGSPASGVVVDSQQPDLALQL